MGFCLSKTSISSRTARDIMGAAGRAAPHARAGACFCLFPVASADPEEERVSLGPAGQHAGTLHGGGRRGLSLSGSQQLETAQRLLELAQQQPAAAWLPPAAAMLV